MMGDKLIFIVHIIYYLGFGFACGAWQDGVHIKSHLRKDEVTKLGSFDGNANDHLTLLSWTDRSLFIGAKDALYNISKTDLTKNTVLNWTVSAHHQEMCQFKGQADSECHNFLRVFHGPISTGKTIKVGNDSQPEYKYIVCGTNAFHPKCRSYSSDFQTLLQEFSGIGYSPFDPTHQPTSVLHHGSVYSATVADFGGTDSLIYKEPLRTEQYYDLHLSSPSFVSSQSYGDLALFFFRESAIEHSNCGKAVFSRVARICRHDSGSRKHKDRFTTFLKARLNCSIPGEFPFYFDHIQGTTEIFTNINNREEMLYAVFTTPPSSISGSAVCAFYMKDILGAFDGPFKGQANIDSNWGQIRDSEVPSPRPGVCSNNPNQYPSSNDAAFLKGHPLMNEAIQGKVVFTLTTKQNKFSAVTADFSAEVAPYHILYVGTDSGTVLKGITNASTFNSNNWEDNESIFSQSWEVLSEPVKSLYLLSPKKLLVIGERKMVIIPTDNCEKYSSCKKCVKTRDPHCAWSVSKGKCVAKESTDTAAEDDLVQDVTFGKGHQCPKDAQLDEGKKEEASLQKNSIKREWNRVNENCNCGTNDNGQSANNVINSGVQSLDVQMRFFDEQNSLENNVDENRNSENDIADIDKDIKASEVNSREASVNSDSILLATVSSATLSLMVGFSLGFISSRYLSSRNKKRDSSSNAPLSISLNESQRLSKPIDWPADPINPLKNNLNTATLEKEKTVKKIYL